MANIIFWISVAMPLRLPASVCATISSEISAAIVIEAFLLSDRLNNMKYDKAINKMIAGDTKMPTKLTILGSSSGVQ
jgi:hypothetical protein